MFRLLPQGMASVWENWQTGLWSTGAASTVSTPGLAKKKRAVADDQPLIGQDLVCDSQGVRRMGAEVLHLFGEVMDFSGHRIAGARIDLWQAGPDGAYRDPDIPADPRDPFRGFGSAVTDASGHYLFRTILPVAYPGRAPHIHARLLRPGGKQLETQLFLVDAAENAGDWHFASLGPSQQAALSLDPVRRSDGDWEAGFNFVI